MRDLSRLLTIFRQSLGSGANRDASLLHAFNTCYLMREGVSPDIRSKCVAAIIQSGLIDSEVVAQDEIPLTPLVRIGDGSLNFSGLLKSSVKPQTHGTSLDEIEVQCRMSDFLLMKGTQGSSFQSLCDCLQANIPILVTTNDSMKLLQSLRLLSQIVGTKMRRILLSDRSDTT